MPRTAILNRKEIHAGIYFLGLSLLVISMPWSRFMATLSLIILIANWAAEGNFSERFRIFAADRAAVAFTLMYVINIIGLAWSENRLFGVTNDLLHKSPTLFLPLIIVTTTVPRPQRIRMLLFLFIGAVTAVSVAGLAARVTDPVSGYRDGSPFIPGVYYGNLLILAAFQLPLLIRETGGGRKSLIAGILISAWLLFFLFYIRTLTGVASLAGVTLYILILLAAMIRSNVVKISIVLTALIALALAVRPVLDIYHETSIETDALPGSLKSYTADGSPYFHDTTMILRENGYLVYINIAENELSAAWNDRSNLDYYGNTAEGTSLRSVLFRYMASKGLTKDRAGMSEMTAGDIEAVGNGITNYLNVSRAGLYVRIYEELRGLYHYREKSYQYGLASSFTERLDQWRAAIRAFTEKPVFGWGTGSIFIAMNYGFETNGSVLAGNEMKPHNQYLYILLNTGIAGLILYILLYSLFVVRSGVHREFMFRVFIIVFAINFLANNSYESQLGQNPFVFFSLFYCYFYPHISERPIPSANRH